MPQHPGIVAVSTLRGMATALSWSVESALDFADRFVKDVEVPKRAEGVDASGEQQSEEPGSAIASDPAPFGSRSSRWSRLSGYSNPRWSGSCVIPLSSEDPFVDALPAKSDGRSHLQPYVPDYHPDVASLQSPRISMGPLTPYAGSRRVVLDNLPPSIGVTQVLRAISCYGGVMAATVVPDCGSGGVTKSAVVEFVYAVSAERFADHCERNALAFAAEDGSIYEAYVWLVQTASFGYTARDHGFLTSGVTRAIALGGFPVDAVWDLLTLLRTYAVSEVLTDRLDAVVLEFASLFEADRAHRLIKWEWPGLHVGFIDDSSQGSGFRAAIIGHVSPSHLEERWNCAPYNERTLAHYRAARASDQARQQEKQGPMPRRASPGATEKLARCYDVSPSELSSYLAERDVFPDTEYRIIGSTIRLTRRAWSWKVHADDDLKLLMANTLHEPEWADEWDQHFAALGAVNLRTWERYGMLARHRRRKAAEQGIEGWRVPQCEAKCEWGCCDIRALAVPDVVKQYFEGSNSRPPASSNGASKEQRT
ncbi:Nucleotide-binding, alpha-beta plait [Hirsutella rhossiliensis]|uniref:Nucleotide-binding, alpha-beta plait n=1 Tax=Hirsutella rhossiliensis TaxID=111463 RepID=A0A9P8SJ72_9HYPO|nr:Nucleotide-binding, alpha-beta plait [Hirsutella rhossiliensis]KAH0962766.1 Nucleotide-binding, alpha-beta plait [Hirsutella rhossiliensis]